MSNSDPKDHCARFQTHYCARNNTFWIIWLRSGKSGKLQCGGSGVGVIKHLMLFLYLLTAAAQLYIPLTHSITYFLLMRYNHPRGIVNEDCTTKILRISERNNHQ